MDGVKEVTLSDFSARVIEQWAIVFDQERAVPCDELWQIDRKLNLGVNYSW